MAHQYSRVGFKSSVEVNEVNLSLSYGGVAQSVKVSKCEAFQLVVLIVLVRVQPRAECARIAYSMRMRIAQASEGSL